MDQFDFALDDFLQGDVRHAHAGAGGNQRGTTAVELFDALGDQIDQNKWVGDNFRGLIKKIAFHRRTGKSRNRLFLLKRDDVFGEQRRFFFAQNKGLEHKEIVRLFEIFKNKIKNQIGSNKTLLLERKKILKLIIEIGNQKQCNQKLIDDLRTQASETDISILEHVSLNESFIDFVYKLFFKFNNYLIRKDKTTDLFVG